MIVQRHVDGTAFLERAQDWLSASEVEHSLVFLIAHSNPTEETDPDAAAYFATAEKEGAVVACAVRDPPFQPVLTRGDPRAIRALANDLYATYGSLSKVLGPDSVMGLFARCWEKLAGTKGRLGIHQRVFECREAQSPEDSAPGSMRRATTDDVSLIVQWANWTLEEQGVSPLVEPEGRARSMIRSGNLYIWEDEEPVSLAAGTPWASSFATINHVFTPKTFRRRGYATSCVHRLTEQLLASGLSYCCLFTDLANPTSNHIYQKIGYRSVCDMQDVHFGSV